MIEMQGIKNTVIIYENGNYYIKFGKHNCLPVELLTHIPKQQMQIIEKLKLLVARKKKLEKLLS